MNLSCDKSSVTKTEQSEKRRLNSIKKKKKKRKRTCEKGVLEQQSYTCGNNLLALATSTFVE